MFKTRFQIFKFNYSACIILLFAILLCTGEISGQEAEKRLENQSQLIEAVKQDQIGNPEKAIQILEKLKYEPEFKAVSFYMLSRLYLLLGKEEEALRAIEQSVLNEPDNKWYVLLKANMNEHAGQYTETAICYDQLRKLEPANYTFYDNAAFFYLKADKFQEALAIMDLAEKTFGLNPQIAMKKSYVMEGTQKLKKAIELVERCLMTYPNNDDLKSRLRTLVFQTRDSKMIEAYRQKYHFVETTTDSNPQGPKNSNLESCVQDKSLSLDQKIKCFLQLLDQPGFQKSGELSKLLPLTQQLIEQYPDDPKPYCLGGDLHFLNQDYLKAKINYEKSVTKGPVPYAVWDKLLQCLTELGHWNAARKYAHDCMELYPNLSNPYYILAVSSFHLNELNEALQYLDQIEPMISHNLNKQVELLVLKAKIKTLQQLDAKELWNTALEKDAMNWVALEQLSWNCESSKTDLSKVKWQTLIPNCKREEAFTLYQKAKLFFCNNQLTEAQSEIAHLLQSNNSQNPLYIELAIKIYRALGDETRLKSLTSRLNDLKEKQP